MFPVSSAFFIKKEKEIRKQKKRSFRDGSLFLGYVSKEFQSGKKVPYEEQLAG